MKFDEALQIFVPGEPAEATRAVGAAAGAQTLAAALGDGYVVTELPDSAGGFLGAVPHGKDPLACGPFVDFQNDVTAKDLKLRLLEGFRSIEHVKRYTTTGMATDQGKTSNMNALGLFRTRWACRFRRLGRRHFGCRIRRFRLGCLRAMRAARCLTRCGRRRFTLGRWSAGGV